MTDQPPIEDYGVVGDLRTAALVGLDGSIDFLCWPRFDAPTVFARLLDMEKGGSFRLAPEMGPGARAKQLYLPETNVLVTRFLSADGVAEVTDVMPMTGDHGRVVRIAHAVRGKIEFAMRCAPRFDYARAPHRTELHDGAALFRPEKGEAMRLIATAPLEVDGVDAVARFTLKPGESATFLLEGDHGDALPCGLDGYGARCFGETVAYWRGWAQQSKYKGRWREMVMRSALALKLLTSRDTGAIVAAPTFGLPEAIGGPRNWDYRYTWIRDAGFTLYALMRLGYTGEATDFMRWVQARVDEGPRDGTLQVMYGVDGRIDLTESELPHLAGYRGSKPVRIGNGAYDQLQLDIYGALMDAVYLANKYGEPISYDGWVNVCATVDWVCEHWADPDEGIWEFRGGRREFLHSRLMCWVTVDRAIRLASKRSLPAPFPRWVETRNALHHDIFHNFWDEEMGAFVQFKGAKALDAACLLMPLVKFIGPTDPRWLRTLDAVGRELAEDSLVRRYRTDAEASARVDALAGVEGSFTTCSFWYIECLARAGRLDEAQLLFEKMLGYANHLGLYAEELGPAGEHLGNFPQALTHLALISAAFALDRELDGGRRGGWER
ncbi:MAG TPA: glycoside hydrolase family 15 protein [Sphingomonas sp.]|jgi:GH15 family glucan-1,4-alpha-glucosidase